MHKKLLTLVSLLSIFMSEAYSLNPFSSSKPEKPIEHIAIDLGTRTTLIRQGDKTIVDKSAICYKVKSDKLLYIGEEALKRIGKTGKKTDAIRIIKEGNIANLIATQNFIGELFSRASIEISPKVEVVVGVPAVVSPGDTISIEKALTNLGIKESNVSIVYEPVAAAVGEGLPINTDKVYMAIDIGGGTTDIVVIADNEILAKPKHSCIDAGDAMVDSLRAFMRNTKHADVALEDAETANREFGIVFSSKSKPHHSFLKNNSQNSEIEEYTIQGMDITKQMPVNVILTREDMHKALMPVVQKIIDEARAVIQSLDSRTAEDLINNGILLVGGGACIEGIAEVISEGLDGLKVTPAEKPLESVINGLECIAKDVKKYKPIMHKPGTQF